MLGLDLIVSGWAEEVFGRVELTWQDFGFLVMLWEFAVRLLFKGNGYRGLGFLGKEVEEVFAIVGTWE